MSEHKFLPCPFCGSTDVEIGNTHTPYFCVTCQDCEAEIHGEYFDSPDGRSRTTKFSYTPNPRNEWEATYEELHPEYKQAFDSAIETWNKRVDGWMPIETAPTDGTLILTWVDCRAEYAVGYWDESYDSWCSDFNQKGHPQMIVATHWRPLPEKPQECDS